jgi:hypothetical protein
VGTRLKLAGMVLVLCLALCATIVGVIQTVRAVQGLSVLHQHVMTGDVSTIRPWMTPSYIAHVYHVPEHTLDGWLRISDAQSFHHTSLQVLADRLHRPVDALIREIQQDILNYRRQQQPRSLPMTASTSRCAEGPPFVGRSVA